LKNLKIHRPIECSDKELQAFSDTGNALFSLLNRTQKQFACDTLKLRGNELKELSLTITEFAEDLFKGEDNIKVK